MEYAKLELIQQLLRRKPFRPFRVVMRSGARYDIVNPEKVAVAASKAIAFLPRMTDLPDSEIELVYEPRPWRNWQVPQRAKQESH